MAVKEEELKTVEQFGVGVFDFDGGCSFTMPPRSSAAAASAAACTVAAVTVAVTADSVVLVTFCGASYWKVVNSREEEVPMKADFLAALLPLICIPNVFSLFIGLYKWKDDDGKLSCGIYVLRGIGMSLLLGWCCFSLDYPSYLSCHRHCSLLGFKQFLSYKDFDVLSCLAFLLALAAFLVGLFEEQPFVGAGP